MVGKRGYDRDRYVRSESDRCGPGADLEWYLVWSTYWNRYIN